MIWRRLYRLFFLERWWKGPASEARRPEKIPAETREVMYKTELESLIWFLQGQLQERVYYSVDAKGRAIIGTVEDTIATITIHLKGDTRSLSYLAIQLEDGYEIYKAWFQLAFLGLKPSFRRPTLTLKSSWKMPSRGQ